MLVDKNHAALKTVSLPVFDGDDVSALVEVMKAVMNSSGGIGLAANQIGVTKRVITVKTRDFAGEIINPEITRTTDTVKISKEGCLSFPNKTVSKKRNYKITVIGFNASWEPITINAKGLTAYCLQHEIDHLNGITI